MVEIKRSPIQKMILTAAAAALTAALSSCAVQGTPVQPSSLAPQGPDSIRVANLGWWMFAIAGVVLTVVTVLLLIAIFRRRSGGPITDPTLPGDRKALTWVLIGGGVVPALVLAAVMGFSISVENSNLSEATNQMPVIEVIGHQWWWEVRYPQYGFTTANEIYIPAGQTVMFKLTTADVIHSFWVPQLHPKLDMIPGQTNTLTLKADQPGIYRGECAEFCGEQHAHMDLLVIAVPADQYTAWAAKEQQPAPNPVEGSLEKEGQQAFLGSSCVYCHTIRGTNASGNLGPDLTHLASRQTIGAGTLPNTPGNLAGWIINSQSVKPGNRMPPMDLSPDQLQALLAYLKTLK